MTDTASTGTDMSTAEGTPVEASQGAMEASEASGVGQGTDTVSRAEYDALMAMFTAYRVNTVRVATRYGNQMGGCGVVDKAIAEIDPVMKRVTFGAEATVTVKLTVKRVNSREKVTQSDLWDRLGSLMYAFASCRGNTGEVHERDGVVEVVSPFVFTDLSASVDVPPYVSPEQWEAERVEREAAERAERRAKQRAERAEVQARGGYGQCDECDTNLNHYHECDNVECGEYVNRDAQGNRIYDND